MAGAVGFGVRGAYDLEEGHFIGSAVFAGGYWGATIDLDDDLYGVAVGVEVAVELDGMLNMEAVVATTKGTLVGNTAYAEVETDDLVNFSTTLGVAAYDSRATVTFDTARGNTPPEFGPPSARGRQPASSGQTPSTPAPDQGSDNGDSGSQDHYGGADPTAGGSQDSPNPADQAEGFGHMGPPEGSGTQNDGDPGQGSPNPADQAEGFGHMGPPGGHSAGNGGGNDGGGGNDSGGNDGGGWGKPVFLDLDGDGVELVSLEDSNAATTFAAMASDTT